jgi:ribosomal-protein-alanine N-acetyltransferase
LIGQISLGGVILGAMRGGHIGYWIDKNYANKGFTTQAVTPKTPKPLCFEIQKLK